MKKLSVMLLFFSLQALSKEELVVTYYTNLDCPACEKFELKDLDTLQELIKRKSFLRLEIVELFDHTSPESIERAVFLECSKFDSTYWELKQKLRKFRTLDVDSRTEMKGASLEVIKNDEEFVTCTASEEITSELAGRVYDARHKGVKGFPSFVFGNSDKVYYGAKGFAELTELLQ